MNIAYLFPGQGSQHVGMGQKLYETVPASRAVFDLADVHLDFPLSELCFSGPEEELKDTSNQQPALFVCGLAAWEANKSHGKWPLPRYLAGHSLGEITALVASGSLSFVDGLSLVRRRGQLMKQAGEREPGAMTAILALDIDQIEAFCHQATTITGRPVQVANDNCPGQVVVSGDQKAIAEVTRLAKVGGARKIVPLPISIAAHSPLMSSAASEFANAVESTKIGPPNIPVIANVTARPLNSPEAIRAELISQLTAPVLWTNSMRYLLDQGVDTFLEVGPGEVLLGLMKRIERKAKRIKFDIGE